MTTVSSAFNLGIQSGITSSCGGATDQERGITRTHVHATSLPLLVHPPPDLSGLASPPSYIHSLFTPMVFLVNSIHPISFPRLWSTHIQKIMTGPILYMQHLPVQVVYKHGLRLSHNLISFPIRSSSYSRSLAVHGNTPGL